jgi:hypothetical protein
MLLAECGAGGLALNYRARCSSVTLSPTQRFYIKTAPEAAKDATKKLGERIIGTAVVQQASRTDL